MINFEKSFTAIISKHIPDSKKKTLTKDNKAFFCDNSNIEHALAGAYVVYLSQETPMTQDQKEYLQEKIASSLKRYKKNLKEKSIHQ